MVEVKVFAGGAVQTREVDESAFAHPKHGARVLGRTLKDALVMYEANARAGTHKVKTRGEVRGPNHKLWAQKHTGRARMGSDKSPLWRGGGIIFGPQPRDYSYHMPAKARRVALRTALLAKLRDGEIAIADGWPADKPSTKAARAILDGLGASRSALVVSDAHDRTLYLSLRNLPHVEVCSVDELNAHRVLRRQVVVLTSPAYARLEQRMADENKKLHRGAIEPEKQSTTKAGGRGTAGAKARAAEQRKSRGGPEQGG